MVFSIVAILGVSSYINMNSLSNKFAESIFHKFETSARGLGESIAAQIYERYGDVQAFAFNPSVKSLNPELIQNSLDYYVALYGIYDLIVVVDRNGHLVSSNSKDVAGKTVQYTALQTVNFKNESWFKAVISGQSTEDKENNYSGTFIEDFIDDPLMKAAFGENRYGSSFSSAIKNEKGEIIGVISNRAGKRWFEAEVENLYERLHREGFVDLELTVTNGKGQPISYASTDKDGKLQILTDPNRILSEDFVGGMNEAGKVYAARGSGGMISRADDSATDVIGFHKINSKKWISSMGWGTWVHDEAADALKDKYQADKQFYFIFSICLFISIAFALWFAIAISKSIADATLILSKNSDEVSEASIQIASGATELSESATEQAAALQETVAAVDEIGAMVEKNTEATQRSMSVSQQSKYAAEKGQQIMSQMLSAIDDIDGSNDEVSSQIEHSNRQLSEITKLINEIGNKTKVINEIVFQTKLLSFNASVEASRAGEYGKGFAVVADEVGNLAKMSGTAAKEITTLLDESVVKVNAIATETKERVEKLMFTSKQKIKIGADKASDCRHALEEILANVQSVDTLISEISVASSEQSSGIREISKAIGQLEQVTQQNSTVAQKSSVSAEQLRGQAEILNSIVVQLVTIVNGRANVDSNLNSSAEDQSQSEIIRDQRLVG
jgi:methyl-accepting chemotaxis protein